MWFRKKRIWRNKDYDIPVILVKSAGVIGGVEYAEVIYQGRASYVPMGELFKC